ncbi:unnamed protein product [Ilex paraguariensis]|uniref:WRKY domain-containing protein n=1 Tax=Ilex paraguariensis TaxID=185542 RepID=A0ABC8UZS0_9AQUA
MEARMNRPSSGCAVEEENCVESIGHKERCSREASLDELESAKTEMGEVREENARLKKMLEQVEKDYRSLQKRFIDILQQEGNKNSINPSTNHDDQDIEEVPELVSLRLGRSPSEGKKDDNTSSSSKTREDEQSKGSDLKLGLEYNFEGSSLEPAELTSERSPENSFEESKEAVTGETWPPSKVLKRMRSGEDELSSQQPSVKRARVSVRARCDTPTMNDGCQWRKYGQKISKGNPCPRAYYRCTVAPTCPVRKQVQRCVEDMSILISTYEGNHNHPLPISATAMASTTSAAASMLLSGSSSTSQPGLGSSAATATTPSPNLHGLNVNLYDNSRPRPFYLPSSPSSSLPTITLDLTTSNSPFTHFNMFSSSFPPTKTFHATASESQMLPTVWGTGNGYISYGSGSPPSRPSQGQFYQPYVKLNNQASSQQYLTETLTKAITSDPSFRTVIAAAISSIVGGESEIETQGKQHGGERFDQNLKWPAGEPNKAISSNPSYLTRTSSSSSNSQIGSLMLLQQQTPSPFSVLKSNGTTTTADQKKEQSS